MNQRTRVKICGHTCMGDIEASVAAGADAIGVIADVPVDTPREVSVTHARQLLDAVPPFVTGVLVTMPETRGRARTLISEVAPDAVQIHTTLAPSEVADLTDTFSQPILAAVDAADPAAMTEYAAAADAVIVDSIAEDGGGGTGQTHDWTQTAKLIDTLEVPVFLAGGLTPDNVSEAIATVDPFGVDVASGVETTGGQKDHTAVVQFTATAQDRYPEVLSE